MAVWDVYHGVDPFTIDLIRTIQEQEDKLCQLRGQLSKEVKVKPIKIKDWSSGDFIELFEELYKQKYNQRPLHDYDDMSYIKGQITRLIRQEHIEVNSFYAYVMYIFNDDPWVKKGEVPEIGWLFNKKMYKVFRSRVRSNKIEERLPGKGAEKPRSHTLSSEAQSLLRRRGEE